jgi:hypothetical protein
VFFSFSACFGISCANVSVKATVTSRQARRTQRILRSRLAARQLSEYSELRNFWRECRKTARLGKKQRAALHLHSRSGQSHQTTLVFIVARVATSPAPLGFLLHPEIAAHVSSGGSPLTVLEALHNILVKTVKTAKLSTVRRGRTRVASLTY